MQTVPLWRCCLHAEDLADDAETNSRHVPTCQTCFIELEFIGYRLVLDIATDMAADVFDR